MPKSTHIIHRRYRRLREKKRKNRAIWRSAGVLGLGFMLMLCFLLGMVVSGTTAVYAAITQDLPSFAGLQAQAAANGPAPTTQIYAQGGSGPDGRRESVLIYEVADPLGDERQWLTLAQMPQTLIDATIAAEERDFWQEAGAAATIGRLLTANNDTPFSISQRVVQNNLLEPAPLDGGSRFRRSWRQVKALLLAHRAGNTYTREQMLEWYLNTAFYGNLAYGVEAAAHVYFNKPVAALAPAEAAMLAALPQAPAQNPVDAPQEARQRQEAVLEAMLEAGYIDRETWRAAQSAPLAVTPGLEARFDIIAPHFALYVRQELESRFGSRQILRDGLRVYTSLDLEMQRQAECVARAHITRLSGSAGPDLPADERAGCSALEFLPSLPTAEIGVDQGANNAAVIMLDPTTGTIKAMAGSLDYWDTNIDGSFNVAVEGRRQPGSAFQPFTYLTAFTQGYNAATMVLDVKSDFGTIGGAAYVPQNQDGRFHGPMRLRQALGNGYNVPAVQVSSWVGMEKIIPTARSMGLTTLDQSASSYELSLNLGGGEVTLLDISYAYAVIDSMGVMVGQPRPATAPAAERTLDPVAILRVESADGDILYEYEPQEREILSPELAYLMNDLLADRSARCEAFACPNPILELPNNRPTAVKTGTTNDFRDAWTIGYTPQLVTGVWVGNSDNEAMNGVTGYKGAAPIWHALMSWALQGETAVLWPQPPGLIEIAVCETSGLLPTPYCPTVSELFIRGTEPAATDSIYQEVAINRETGRLATIYTPPELVERKIYRIYPSQAAAWARENNVEQPPTEYDTISANPTAGDNAILSPQPFAFVSGQVPITGTIDSENFSFYRLAYFKGFTPANLQSIVENGTKPQENERLAVWDTQNLSGLYTLLLTIVGEDGSFEELSTHVTVDNVPPTVVISSPVDGAEIAAGPESLTIRAQVDDNVALEQVAFYADGDAEPFAVRRGAPFTAEWTVAGSGCHTFRVVAVDAAGNEAESTAVSACFPN